MNAPTATAPTQPGFAALKTCQQGTSLSSDYALTGMPSRIVGEAPCETLQVRAGREQTAIVGALRCAFDYCNAALEGHLFRSASPPGLFRKCRDSGFTCAVMLSSPQLGSLFF